MKRPDEITALIAASLKVPKNTTRVVITLEASALPNVEVTYLLYPPDAGDDFVTVIEQFELRKKQ